MFPSDGKSDTTATLKTDQNSTCQKIYKQNVFVCTLLTTIKIGNFVITDHNDMKKELKEQHDCTHKCGGRGVGGGGWGVVV